MSSATPSQTSLSSEESLSLPQYGFGSDSSFDSLVKHNHFLFRVYTPKSRPASSKNSGPYFIAPKFDEKYTVSPDRLDGLGSASTGTYADAAKHLDWRTRMTSPYISSSFSFVWSVWEALRRYHTNVKHDIHIAVIDVRQVSDRAVTAVELLRKSTREERHRDYWKWYQFALESQSVLVYGAIPASAILTSIPILPILDKLPLYFMRSSALDQNLPPLDRVAWDYARQKPNYHKFCQDMSQRFLLMSTETRLRETSAGSVRLALAVLRPWFYEVILEDFQEATGTLCELAFVIAQWPAQWWARDHKEIWDLIRSMVIIVGEEARDKQRSALTAEVARLHKVVDGLEQAVMGHDAMDLDEEVTVESNDTGDTSDLKSPAPTPSVRADLPAKPHSMAETVSCMVTGLLFGCFLTLCIMSPQRRTLATHLT